MKFKIGTYFEQIKWKLKTDTFILNVLQKKLKQRD